MKITSGIIKNIRDKVFSDISLAPKITPPTKKKIHQIVHQIQTQALTLIFLMNPGKTASCGPTLESEDYKRLLVHCYFTQCGNFSLLSNNAHTTSYFYGDSLSI